MGIIKSKEKTTSKELGNLLFCDFIGKLYKNFYNNIEKTILNNSDDCKIKKEDIIEMELLTAYVWLVFHFLHVAGKKFQQTASCINYEFYNFYKKSALVDNLPMLSGQEFFNILEERSNQYKKAFMSDEHNMNFHGVSMIIADNVLNKQFNVNFFFTVQLGICLQEAAISLGEFLKEVELTD